MTNWPIAGSSPNSRAGRQHSDHRRVRRRLHHWRCHRHLQSLWLSPRHQLFRLSAAWCLARRLLHEHERVQLRRHGFLGPQPFAFDRAKMLAGLPATFITRFHRWARIRLHSCLSDLDGYILPPRRRAEPFCRVPGKRCFTTYGTSTPILPRQLTRPLLSSPVRPPRALPQLCPSTRACVPQLGAGGPTDLDGIGDRLMFRLAYRNFGDGTNRWSAIIP